MSFFQSNPRPERKPLQLVAPDRPTRRSIRERMSKGSVGPSEDLDRILALPRRGQPDPLTLSLGMTAFLKKPDGKQCLRPIQAWALAEAAQCNGLLAPISVGGGKTLLGLLMPMVMPKCKVAVLLIPPQLRAQLLLHDWDAYGKHWELPNLAGGRWFTPGRPVLHVVAYSELSSPKSTALLDQIQPDLVLADECFPAGTEVLTNSGSKSIESVEAGDLVRALNPATGAFEWRPVKRTISKVAAQLIRVNFQGGSLVCTPSHKLWTEEHGYVRADESHECTLRVLPEAVRAAGARKRAPVLFGEVLPKDGAQSEAVDFRSPPATMQSMRRGLYAQSTCECQSVLLQAMPGGRAAPQGAEQEACVGSDDVRGVSPGFRYSEQGKEYSSCVFSGVLEPEIRVGRHSRQEREDRAASEGATSTPRSATPASKGMCCLRSAVPVSAVCAPGEADVLLSALRAAQRYEGVSLGEDWKEGSSDCRAHAAAQPYQDAGGDREDKCGPQRANVPGAWGERQADGPPDAASGEAWGTHGVCYPYARGVGAVQVLARLLQSGYGPARVQTRNRSGRELPQDSEVEVPRQAEDSGFVCARVDGVEVLERGSADGHELGPASHRVYDLEVEYLHNYVADGVVVSNCHKLRGALTTARGRRFIRFFADHPETRFCGWSGTITSKSLLDYAHLLAIALDSGAPVPLDPSEVESWAMALDPTEYHFDPGELSRLCAPGEDVRSGYRRRLVDTLGVVASGESELGTSLVFYERKAPPIPEEVLKDLRELRRSPDMGGWKRPDGEELPDVMRVQACARELAQGLYMRWKFPRNEPLPIRAHWFARRQEFNRELREKLKHPAPHLDSPLLCIKAAMRWYDGGCPVCHRKAEEPHREGCDGAESRPLWPSFCWPAWYAAKDTVVHKTEVVWVDEYLMRDAAEWAKEEPGIVWVEHPAVGEKIAQLSGFKYFGGGEQASIDIIKEDGKRSIICSIRARSEGLNLQTAFWRNLIVAPPGDNSLVEQAVGRTHRPGQVQDEVEVWFYLHTSEMSDALDRARERSEYVQATTGSAQKLVYGSWVLGERPEGKALAKLPWGEEVSR